MFAVMKKSCLALAILEMRGTSIGSVDAIRMQQNQKVMKTVVIVYEGKKENLDEKVDEDTMCLMVKEKIRNKIFPGEESTNATDFYMKCKKPGTDSEHDMDLQASIKNQCDDDTITDASPYSNQITITIEGDDDDEYASDSDTSDELEEVPVEKPSNQVQG